MGDAKDHTTHCRCGRYIGITSATECEICRLERRQTERITALEILVEMQDKLLVAYRIGTRPPEYVFDKMAKAKKTLADLAGGATGER